MLGFYKTCEKLINLKSIFHLNIQLVFHLSQLKKFTIKSQGQQSYITLQYMSFKFFLDYSYIAISLKIEFIRKFKVNLLQQQITQARRFTFFIIISNKNSKNIIVIRLHKVVKTCSFDCKIIRQFLIHQFILQPLIYSSMYTKQNSKGSSAKSCGFLGHQDQNTNLICGYERCDLDDRWICAKCVISKIHDHNLTTEKHIFDQEQFYKLLKDKQELIYEEINERCNKVRNFQKQLRWLSQSINLILQQLENELQDFKITESTQLIDQMITKTEEDFSQITSQEIIQFHNIKLIGYFDKQLKEEFGNIEKATQKIKQDIEQLSNKVQISMDQREKIIDDKNSSFFDIEIQNQQSPSIKKSIKLICSLEDIEQQNESITEIIKSKQGNLETNSQNELLQTINLPQDQPQNYRNNQLHNNQDSPVTSQPQYIKSEQTQDQIFKVSQKLLTPSSQQTQKAQIFSQNQNKQVHQENKVQDRKQQNIFQNDKQSLFTPRSPKQAQIFNQSPNSFLNIQQRFKTDYGTKTDRDNSIQQQQIVYHIETGQKIYQKNSVIDKQIICKKEKSDNFYIFLYIFIKFLIKLIRSQIFQFYYLKAIPLLIKAKIIIIIFILIMNSQQNLQVPSLKFCMVEGHQNQISTNICLYDKCELNNRWICIKCVLQKKHSHNLEGDNHIVDSEMFYKLLKDKEDQSFKQIKEISEKITSFIKKMKILVDDINNIQQQVEKEKTAICKNKNLQLIGQMIKITEEDFSKISNEQIVEFLHLSMSSNAFLYQEFKLNLIRINQNNIIADVDKNYCSDQLLKKTYIKKEDLQNSQNMNDAYYKNQQQENGEIEQNNMINKDQQKTNNNIEIQQIEKNSLSRKESPYIQNSLPAYITVTKQEEDEGEWEDYDGEDHNQCQDNHYQNQETHQNDLPLIINQTADKIKGMKEQEDDEGEWEDDERECEADDKQEKQDQPQIPTSNPVITKPTTEQQFNLLNNKIDQVQETQAQVSYKKWLFDQIFKKSLQVFVQILSKKTNSFFEFNKIVRNIQLYVTHIIAYSPWKFKLLKLYSEQKLLGTRQRDNGGQECHRATREKHKVSANLNKTQVISHNIIQKKKIQSKDLILNERMDQLKLIILQDLINPGFLCQMNLFFINIIVMQKKANIKLLISQRTCIQAGHKAKIPEFICTFDKCSLNNRWVCVYCALEYIHKHGLETSEHIMEKEKFLEFIQQKEQHKYYNELLTSIEQFINELNKLSQTIIEYLKTETIRIKNENNLNFIEDSIKIIKEDFYILSNEQINKLVNMKQSLIYFDDQKFSKFMEQQNSLFQDFIVILQKATNKELQIQEKQSLQNSIFKQNKVTPIIKHDFQKIEQQNKQICQGNQSGQNIIQLKQQQMIAQPSYQAYGCQKSQLFSSTSPQSQSCIRQFQPEDQIINDRYKQTTALPIAKVQGQATPLAQYQIQQNRSIFNNSNQILPYGAGSVQALQKSLASFNKINNSRYPKLLLIIWVIKVSRSEIHQIKNQKQKFLSILLIQFKIYFLCYLGKVYNHLEYNVIQGSSLNSLNQNQTFIFN
ncbi:hypothetical protein pb186bvf_018322 [Paramecium bursaria]